ncbi:HNH endonuclease [Streptomyces sp. DSM 42041]|uniref:HNH endonuclease n=1 Tax=Streptomyces hazeniae TaxID=3075538 RepID=A0ABU2NT95_9ACTN|nr:HNH endonuclease [Streptomyces sp. DSM 42041]MDT0380205.1 HNH endonuclease [Streptomyces sp. DSM 42041]
MDWVGRVGELRQWSANGVRAPHKPLLLLYALGRFQEDADAGLRYSAVENDLKRLLAEYGPAHRTTPAYPFHHLAGDGVWEVRTDGGQGSPGTGVGALRESGATGRLAPGLRQALADDAGLADRLAAVLLDLHFPPSLHEELLDAVGLATGAGVTDVVTDVVPSARGRRDRRTRDRRMRDAVLTAYEYRCAFCGYDGSIGAVPVGLEAAHVRWWAFDGPDAVENGLCLCSLHHRLFDKGVLGVGVSREVMVSQHFVGRGRAAREQVLELAGRPLIGPQRGAATVAADHRDWHARNVFRGAPRQAVRAE